MNTKIFWLLLLCSGALYPQEMANALPLDLKKNKGVFQVVNNPAKQTSLFFADKTDITSIRLDQNMQPIDSVTAKRPEKAYDRMVGSNLDGNNPRLFWMSSNHEKICLQLFDFDKRAATNQFYELQYEGERFLESFSSQDHFVILSVLKRSSSLRLYVFGNDGQMETKTVALSGKFFDYNYKPTDLYGVLAENFMPFEAPYTLQKITSESPVSMTEGAKKRKAYFDGRQLILTFDTNPKYTHLITIDMANYSANEQVFQMPFVDGNDFTGVNSNSFLTADGKLLQMKVSSDKLVFSIKDKNADGAIVKEYTAYGEKPIDFKNSDIIQEKGDYGNTRTLEKTSQFLRKTNNMYSGVSASEIDGNYLVTMGSVSEPTNNMMMFGAAFGAAGVIVAAVVWNPTYDSFNSYQNRKVVTINCLFDKQGEHVPGAVKTLAFDKMRGFMDQQKGITSPTIFKLGTFYYLGFYKKDDKKYYLHQFEE